jgi:hypothetical protein
VLVTARAGSSAGDGRETPVDTTSCPEQADALAHLEFSIAVGERTEDVLRGMVKITNKGTAATTLALGQPDARVVDPESHVPVASGDLTVTTPAQGHTIDSGAISDVPWIASLAGVPNGRYAVAIEIPVLGIGDAPMTPDRCRVRVTGGEFALE